jgi:hypothetical protein
MCLTFAGDEAGDASFSFDEGASTHFVLALIATAQPDTLREALARLREQRGLPADYEFKHHRLSSAALRHAVIEALQVLDFEVYALAVDKVTLPVYLRTLDAHSFYALLAAELIVQVPLSEREGAILLLDEFDPRGRALLALKRGSSAEERGVDFAKCSTCAHAANRWSRSLTWSRGRFCAQPFRMTAKTRTACSQRSGCCITFSQRQKTRPASQAK